MNSTSLALLEDLTGNFTIPVTLAARILGLSLRRLKKELPIVDSGYRSKEVTIRSMREWLQRHEVRKAS
jgi:hypothetical protein